MNRTVRAFVALLFALGLLATGVTPAVADPVGGDVNQCGFGVQSPCPQPTDCEPGQFPDSTAADCPQPDDCDFPVSTQGFPSCPPPPVSCAPDLSGALQAANTQIATLRADLAYEHDLVNRLNADLNLWQSKTAKYARQVDRQRATIQRLRAIIRDDRQGSSSR